MAQSLKIFNQMRKPKSNKSRHNPLKPYIMKKGILLLLGVLMMVSTVEAKTSNKQPNSKWDYNYHDEPISFKERGIKFYIFPDGEMDFNIHGNDYGTTTEYYYKGNKSKSNARSRNGRRGTKVVRDYRGRVIRVGRVFINYNYRGNVSRVGTVFVSYRRNRMTRVGGLRIIHTRYGMRYVGSVKPRRHHYNTGYYEDYYDDFYDDYFYDDYVYDFDDNFFDDDDFDDDYEQFNEDDDYYYYRSKAKTNKKSKGKSVSKQKMLKRKKKNTGKTKIKTKKRIKRKILKKRIVKKAVK